MKQTLLAVLLFGLVASVQAQTPKRTMALTFDDLPYVNMAGGAYVAHARAATTKILNTLKKHNAPAVAFVNEGKLTDSAEREARIDLLRQWVKQGETLGNHTYSHRDFNQLTVEQFEADIANGDADARQLIRYSQPQ